MSSKDAQTSEARSGVLSWFSHKKKTAFKKESYELTPMYWKCVRHETTKSVSLQGFRSEQSRSGKPRITLIVNGCTTELLPPMLGSKGIDHPGNDNFLCIQSDDDKIVFLKAEGRSQRDEWFEAITGALGERRPVASNAMSNAAAGSPCRLPPAKPDSSDDDSTSMMSERPPMEHHNAVYHLPYQDFEPMHCSSSAEDDPPDEVVSEPSASGGDDESSTGARLIDENGYMMPKSSPKKKIKDKEIIENGSTATSHVGRYPSPQLSKSPVGGVKVSDPAFRSELLVTMKNAKENKPKSTEDNSPKHTRPAAGVRRNKPVLPEPPPKVPFSEPKGGEDVGNQSPREPAPPRNKPNLPEPPPKVPLGEPKGAHVKKPLRAPPPLPAGGKPKSVPVPSEKQEAVPSAAVPPMPKPRLIEPPPPPPQSSSKSETGPQDGSPTKSSTSATEGDGVYQFVRTFRTTRMLSDPIAIELNKEHVNRDTLKIVSVTGSLFIGHFGKELRNSELLVGDEITEINSQTVLSVEGAYKAIKSTEGNMVTFSIKKLPHGVLSYISRPQESRIDLKKLGLELKGNEIIKFESEGLVARSGIPSQVQVPGITNGGELGNWALTQVNLAPVLPSDALTDIEQRLAEAGTNMALVFQPLDLAQALFG